MQTDIHGVERIHEPLLTQKGIHQSTVSGIDMHMDLRSVQLCNDIDVEFVHVIVQLVL